MKELRSHREHVQGEFKLASETFIIYGQVNVSVTITEVNGTLQFQLNVLDDTGQIGDLNALFFDLSDDALTSGLHVTGQDVTGVNLDANRVVKVDSYTTMNGEVVKDLGKFDGGVQFGTAGIGSDDIRSTTFVLTHDSQNLTLADFSTQDFGIRLTSVGAEDGIRTDSLKLGGAAPLFDIGGPEDSTAGDDTFVVTEKEGDNPPGIGDFGTDGFEFNVLDNDGPDGTPYVGTVTTVNGVPIGGLYVEGSDGGSVIIYADGRVDFSVYDNAGNDDFAALNDGQTATTTFTYGTDDGSQHGLTIEVTGSGTDGSGIINA